MGIRFMKKSYEIQSNIENGRIYEAKCGKKINGKNQIRITRYIAGGFYYKKI